MKTQFQNFKIVSILLIGFLVVFAASCSDSGTGVEEEPEEPIYQDEDLAILTSATVNRGNNRWKEVATTDIRNQRMKSRTTVNVAGPGDSKSASAVGYARFSAKKEQALLLADINWKGTMLSAVNLSSTTEMTVTLRVREINSDGSAGTIVLSEQLERDGIGSGLRAVQVLNIEDSIRDTYQLNNLKVDQIYRIEVAVNCRLRVDVVSLSVVDCNAFTDDRGVFVEQSKIQYE